MARAVIVVDVQNQWAAKDTDYYILGFEDLVEDINDLIEFCREDGDMIIFTQHVETDSEVFQEGTASSQLASTLKRAQTDKVVRKETISPFLDSDLDDVLENVEEIIVCGAATNLGVRQVVEEAYDRDLDITIISDCCACPSEYAHVFTLKDLELTRPEIDIVTDSLSMSSICLLNRTCLRLRIISVTSSTTPEMVENS